MKIVRRPDQASECDSLMADRASPRKAGQIDWISGAYMRSNASTRIDTGVRLTRHTLSRVRSIRSGPARGCRLSTLEHGGKEQGVLCLSVAARQTRSPHQKESIKRKS